MNYATLAAIAQEARAHSYSPYSGFQVGAALLSSDGRVFTGCNVEISTLALTVCAERVAVFKAYSEGVRSFRAIAVAASGPGYTPPCGACRQVLMDLAGTIDVILVDSSGRIEILTTAELLPHPFGPENLRRLHDHPDTP